MGAYFFDFAGKNKGGDRAIYLQISRGAYARRDLSIPVQSDTGTGATVFAMVLHVEAPDIDELSAGISVITVEDFRWNACDIKSTSLVANVMLRQQAAEANAGDAILIKNGMVTEGTASNVFMVKNNVLITPPTGRQLLPGITRDLVIEIARNNAISVEEREIQEAELYDADEIWMTSSTREIAPVVTINGNAVNDNTGGSAVAGAMWQRMMGLYQQYKQTLRSM